MFGAFTIGGFGGNKEHGAEITTEQLKELLTMEPRRHRLSDPTWHNLPWNALRAPIEDATDWILSFPFFETFCPAFDEFCLSRAEASPIEKLPFERNDGTRVRYTYLKKTSDGQLNDIGEWLSFIGRFVGIRDFLRVSFALDYTCEGGNPGMGTTGTGRLRQTAKLYGASDSPSTETLAAASRLAEECIKFMQLSRAYYQVNSVMAIPRSDPTKTYSLPEFFVDRTAKDLGLEDLSGCIKTTKARREMKDTPANERLQELDGTTIISNLAAVKGKRILIIDDLYQSGTTMNYVGKLLLDSGASRVYGLACEKTCSNQD